MKNSNEDRKKGKGRSSKLDAEETSKQRKKRTQIAADQAGYFRN